MTNKMLFFGQQHGLGIGLNFKCFSDSTMQTVNIEHDTSENITNKIYKNCIR